MRYLVAIMLAALAVVMIGAIASGRWDLASRAVLHVILVLTVLYVTTEEAA